MKINDFLCEQWMTEYETEAIYNMTDTSFQALSLQELLSMEEGFPQDLILDYGEITGKKALKQEILKLYQTGNEENIVCFPGALNANQHVMDALLQAGDHVIAFVPGYQQFYDYPLSLGCEVTCLSFHEEQDWKFSMDEVKESIRKNTKMIVLASPSNPTGTMLTKQEWQQLIELCAKNAIYILCDEVYRGLDIEKTISVSDLYEFGISTSSLSKIFSLPGLRLGWVKAAPFIIDQLVIRRDYTMISTGPLLDHLGWIALKNKEKILGRNRAILKANQMTLKSWLQENKEFSVVLNEFSPVVFLKYNMDIPSAALCTQVLKEKGIFFVPGTCFGREYHVRLGLGRDPKQFENGLKLFAKWSKEALKKTYFS